MHELTDLDPKGTRILCSRFYQPEQATGKIVLNPAWRRDNNRQIWRLLHWGEKAASFLREAGIEPKQGMLLLTPPNQGVLASSIEHDKELFWLWAEQVIAHIEEEEEA